MDAIVSNKVLKNQKKKKNAQQKLNFNNIKNIGFFGMNGFGISHDAVWI